jgi:hypothetical protein
MIGPDNRAAEIIGGPLDGQVRHRGRAKFPSYLDDDGATLAVSKGHREAARSSRSRYYFLDVAMPDESHQFARHVYVHGTAWATWRPRRRSVGT